METWLGPISEIFHRMGIPAEHARENARLAVAVAVTRGLLLDLLVTGDRVAATHAFERFLSTYETPRVQEPANSGSGRPRSLTQAP